ncbi:UNVERIFIED_CONTAM: hypothetical protein RMT77_014905 [Armadillidium vulgare]
MASRLEYLCGIQMAIELSNKLEFKIQILRLPDLDLYRSLWYCGSERWFENTEKKVLDVLKELPFGLREKIPTSVVIFCLSQSMEWAKFLYEEFDLPLDYSCSFLKSSFFTSKGILNEEKAAREILKDTELSPSLKFCIACYYCLSDVIPVLWEQLPVDKRPKSEIDIRVHDIGFRIRKEMAILWSYSLLGKPNFIMKKMDDSFSLYKFKKTFDNESYRNCSDVAFKKCFEELNESEKEEALIFTRDKLTYFLSNMETFGYCESDTTPYLFPLQLFLPYQKYLEIAIFLLRHLDHRRLKEFFQPVTLHYVLFHSLSWPYQHMFMDIVSQFWEVLPKSGFCLLLHRIMSLIENKSSSKLCDYHKILRDFWIQSSSSLKRFFFHLEGIDERDMLDELTYEESDNFLYALHLDFKRLDYSYVIYKLFDSPFTTEDEKTIKLIFSSATLEEKSDIVRLQGDMIGKISFEACDIRRIDLFMECCCVPKERIESFKMELCNDEDVKEVLFSLVVDNKGKEFQKILNWAFSTEEVNEWLKDFLLYVRQKWEITWCSWKDMECIVQCLEWSLPSNEIQNFKESLVLDVGNIAWHFKYPLSKGDFEYIDLFLEWIFSSEIEIVKFKKVFIFESIRYIDDSFLSSGLSLLKKIIKWSSLSKEESKDFRRQFAFDEKVIKYYSDLVAQRQLYKVDALTRWVELTETEVKIFKRLLVFYVQGDVFSSCVSFILKGKRGFVKKLLNWTQFSKEEVKEFYSLLPEELNLYTRITAENTKLDNLKEFFNGFPLSENEIKRHKKDLLFKSLNLIEYFVVEKRWDEIEELLGWCFSSKTEICEFKKKIPLKINHIFLNLILYQRYDDVDKFFTWTGVHNSLKKRLLKKAIFDSRVYQNVSSWFYCIGTSTSIIERLLKFLSSNDLLSNKWKDSFLNWYYDYRNRSDCDDVNCLRIRRSDIQGFGMHQDISLLCGACRDFIVVSNAFVKLVDKHSNILKVGPKRKLESSIQINSTKAKRFRHRF